MGGGAGTAGATEAVPLASRTCSARSESPPGDHDGAALPLANDGEDASSRRRMAKHAEEHRSGNGGGNCLMLHTLPAAFPSLVSSVLRCGVVYLLIR
jgi:hypothetical protein